VPERVIEGVAPCDADSDCEVVEVRVPVWAARLGLLKAWTSGWEMTELVCVGVASWLGVGTCDPVPVVV